MFGEILAILTGAHDEGIDENADGLLEALRVTLDLDVRTSGSYRLSADLSDVNGKKPLSSSSYNPNVMLAAGLTRQTYRNASESIINLVYDGTRIGRNGINGL